MGHSAGGWLGRAFLADPRYAPGAGEDSAAPRPQPGTLGAAPHPAVRGLVTLGTPQRPPPPDKKRDMTGTWGACRWVARTVSAMPSALCAVSRHGSFLLLLRGVSLGQVAQGKGLSLLRARRNILLMAAWPVHPYVNTGHCLLPGHPVTQRPAIPIPYLRAPNTTHELRPLHLSSRLLQAARRAGLTAATPGPSSPSRGWPT